VVFKCRRKQTKVSAVLSDNEDEPAIKGVKSILSRAVVEDESD
jgi:hypothetical protein